MTTLKDVMKACNDFGTNFYTLSGIAKILELDRKIARHKLGKLERAGLIRRVKEQESMLPNLSKGRPVKEIFYRNKKGLPKKLTERFQQKDNAWDRMWKAARMLRHFTRNDLAIICNANIENVRYFTKAYTKAGYLRTSQGRGREKTWLLIKDPGPQRPYYHGGKVNGC